MRYNIFNKVHRPLKESLLSTCISLSRNGEWNISSALEAIRKVEEVLEICDEQVKYEAINILPFIFEYEPSVWNAYTSEHHKVMNLCRDIKSLVQSFYKLKGTENKFAVMELISEKFNEFMLLNYNHMDDEEAVLNEILWRYYTDAFIIEMENHLTIVTASVKQPKKKGMQMANAA
jgi:aspartate-semialdehyde dehydrogenase